MLGFFLAVLTLYRRAKKTGRVQYLALSSSHGIPYTTIIFATGREAWRVSKVAIESFEGECKLEPYERSKQREPRQ
jgi:hypothetical protein